MKVFNNNKGFTLIEVLGVIVILGIIASITIYSTINIINNIKVKSYRVTVNNIQIEANNYVTEEEISSGKWMSYGGTNSEYQCVSVQNLIDAGYFDKEVLKSSVSEDRKVMATDNVFLLRDKNSKSIIKSVLDYNGVLGAFCSNYDADYNISFGIAPGWAREKDIDIEYNISNIPSTSSVGDYKYEYKYQVNDSIVNNKINSFSSFDIKDKLTVNKNGQLIGKINDKDGYTKLAKTLDVDSIDDVNPYGSIVSTNNLTNRQTVTLNMNDNESGVSAYYFGTMYPIGNNISWVSTEKNSSTVTVTTTVSDGGVYYLAIKDAVGNVGVVQKKFYKTTLSISNATLKVNNVVTMEGYSFTPPTPVMDPHYTFEGWYSNSSYVGTVIAQYTPTGHSTLYGKTIRNAYNVIISYRVNGGTVTTTTSGGTWTTDSNGYIYLNGSKYTTTISYNAQFDVMLINPYNITHLYVIKNGYEVSTVNQWKCANSNCVKTEYNDYDSYEPSDFCDASEGDCSVTLDVNWVGRTYTINYVLGGGFSSASTLSSNDKYCSNSYTVGGNHDITGTMVSQTCVYGQKCTLNNANFSRQCHLFKGWTTNSNVDTKNYTEKKFGANNATEQFFSDGDDFTYNKVGNMTLYAVWLPNHTWHGIGNQIHDSGTSKFTCEHVHYKGAYFKYCSVCQMGHAHYKHCYKPEWSEAGGNMWCPCSAGGGWVTYDERGSFGSTYSDILYYEEFAWGDGIAHYYGGIVESPYNGWVLKTLGKGNLAARICVDHHNYIVTLDNQGATSSGTAVLYGSIAIQTTAGDGIHLRKDEISGEFFDELTTSKNPIIIPSKNGYTFGGYYTKKNGGGSKIINAKGYVVSDNPVLTRTKSNVILYAYWK